MRKVEVAARLSRRHGRDYFRGFLESLPVGDPGTSRAFLHVEFGVGRGRRRGAWQVGGDEVDQLDWTIAVQAAVAEAGVLPVRSVAAHVDDPAEAGGVVGVRVSSHIVARPGAGLAGSRMPYRVVRIAPPGGASDLRVAWIEVDTRVPRERLRSAEHVLATFGRQADPLADG